MTATAPTTRTAQSTFRAPWWLRNGHAQTLFATLCRRVPMPPLQLERWPLRDGDFVRVHTSEAPTDGPSALLIHGLEGSIQSPYQRGLAARLLDEGFWVAALELRSCGGEMNRLPRAYHSGATEDLEDVVEQLLLRRPDRPLCVVGVSLGGNLLTKWLGERGEDAPAQFAAGAAVSAPFELARSAHNIDEVGLGLYRRHFLRRLIDKAVAKEQQHPGLLDIDTVRRCRGLVEFDHHVTARLHGFRDADDYYTRSSCGQFLPAIQRPLLLLSSADDPFNPAATLPREAVAASPFLTAEFTRHGGHVGFIHGTPWRPRCYIEDRVARWFRDQLG